MQNIFRKFSLDSFQLSQALSRRSVRTIIKKKKPPQIHLTEILSNEHTLEIIRFQEEIDIELNDIVAVSSNIVKISHLAYYIN